MEYENVGFGEFLAATLKERGVSVKKLAELTGIAPNHLERLLRDDFEGMPSAPYLRGYMLRIGRTLDFNGEEWWNRIRTKGVAKNSGGTDTLPENRFMRKAPTKLLWTVAVAAVILIYLGFQAPRIFGRPTLVVTFPSQSPFTTGDNTFTFTGTVHNADSLTLNGDPITINPDGTWQKGVLLQNGLNPFKIEAKKLLGASTVANEEIIYIAPATATTTPTSTAPLPKVHFETTTPATGTFFE